MNISRSVLAHKFTLQLASGITDCSVCLLSFRRIQQKIKNEKQQSTTRATVVLPEKKQTLEKRRRISTGRPDPTQSASIERERWWWLTAKTTLAQCWIKMGEKKNPTPWCCGAHSPLVRVFISLRHCATRQKEMNERASLFVNAQGRRRKIKSAHTHTQCNSFSC